MEYIPNFGNYPVNNRSSLYSLKSFKWRFAAARYQTNNPSKSTTPEKKQRGNSLAVQWLGLHVTASVSLLQGSIPGQGNKMPQAILCKKKQTNKQKTTLIKKKKRKKEKKQRMTYLRIMNVDLWPVNVTGINQRCMTYGYHTKQYPICKNYRSVADSGAKNLKFDQRDWEFDQKGELFKNIRRREKSQPVQGEVTCPKNGKSRLNYRRTFKMAEE